MKPMQMLIGSLNTRRQDECQFISKNKQQMQLESILVSYSSAADDRRRTQSRQGLRWAESQRSNRGQQTLCGKSELLQGITPTVVNWFQSAYSINRKKSGGVTHLNTIPEFCSESVCSLKPWPSLEKQDSRPVIM